MKRLLINSKLSTTTIFFNQTFDMKKLLDFLFSGLLVSIYGLVIFIWPITALITHIWTVVVAFEHGGMVSGVISFFVPFLSEIYWLFKMFGVNNFYAYIALAHLILALPYSMFSKEHRFKRKYGS